MASDQQRRPTGDNSLLDSVSIGGGLLGGIVAYLLGYGVIVLSKSDAIDNVTGLFSFFEQLAGQIDYPAGWKLAGWAFYRAHNVDILIDMTASDSPNLFALTESTLWEGWFYVLPIVALVVAGAGVAYVASARTPANGFVAGGSIVGGYVLAVLAGAWLTRWSVSSSGIMSFEASAGPDLIVAVAIAGIVYPLVVGGIGGALVGAIRSR